MSFANILPEYLETQGFCPQPASDNQKVKEIKHLEQGLCHNSTNDSQGLCHNPTNDSQGLCLHSTDDSQTGGK